MRRLLAASLAASAVLAVLVVVPMASAEIHLWVWLPGDAGTHFSGKSGKNTLQETTAEAGLGATLTCKESKLSEKESELTSPATDANLALAIIEKSGCKELGVAAPSLGDASGIVLEHVELHNCNIAKGSGRGVIVEPLPVHVDPPATGLLTVFDGAYIAELKPVGAPPAKTWELVLEQKEGQQSIKECEGGAAINLTANTDNNGVKKAGAEMKETTITFTVAQEAMN
jgi:hypothetical protein